MRAPSVVTTAAARVIARASIGILAIEVAWVAFVLLGGDPRFQVATDFHIYRDAAERWQSGGGFYLEEQLGGPYGLRIGHVLYPPVILWLLVPFVFLPAVLWWIIPVGVTAFAVYRFRPMAFGWLVLVILCLWPRTPQIVIHGNPTMWVVAIESLALLYAWPGPFVLIKPVLAPFALIGARRREWWIGLSALIAMSVPFGDMWLDWFQLTIDSGGAVYSLGDYLPMLLPLLAWRFGHGRRSAQSVATPQPLSFRPRTAKARK